MSDHKAGTVARILPLDASLMLAEVGGKDPSLNNRCDVPVRTLLGVGVASTRDRPVRLTTPGAGAEHYAPASASGHVTT